MDYSLCNVRNFVRLIRTIKLNSNIDKTIRDYRSDFRCLYKNEYPEAGEVFESLLLMALGAGMVQITKPGEYRPLDFMSIHNWAGAEIIITAVGLTFLDINQDLI